MKTARVLVAAAAAFTVSAVAMAEVIISNHPGNDGTQSAGINDSSRTKGMGFEMSGGSDMTLDGVTLRLDITSVDVAPVIEIYSDGGGVPGALLTTLVNPSTFSPGIGDYIFTPDGSFTLVGGETYWIVASSAAGTYDWKASSPAETPTGTATHVGATFGAYPPAVSSSILNTYFVEASSASCRADLDGDGQLTIFDFLAFQNLFDAGDPIADFDGDGSLTIFDFLAFQNEFDAGCE
ncbi:MAG: choice-of-anchor R domain-containing protein [Phycisphaerales bacterium]|jgi:hypothetical protein